MSVTSIQSWKKQRQRLSLKENPPNLVNLVGVKSNRFLGLPIHWDLKVSRFARTWDEVRWPESWVGIDTWRDPQKLEIRSSALGM